MKTPILLLAFNRPELTLKVFDKIKLIKPKFLFVSIDGPRIGNQFDLAKIESTLSIFEQIDWECKLVVNRFETNLGCGKAVYQGIDWFFSHVELGIILEDDTIPSLSFFEFSNILLDKYLFNEEIMAINGSNPLGNCNHSQSYFFSKYNFCWGWATWRRAWSRYRFDLSYMSTYEKYYILIRRFGIDYISIRSWFKHVNLTINNKIDTWDYQWMFICFKYRAKIITPSINMVSNVGNDIDATHRVTKDVLYLNLRPNEITFPLIHPECVTINHNLDNKIRKVRYGNIFSILLSNKIKSYKLFK